MTRVSTAQCRHSKYYLAKLHNLNLRYRKGGQEASKALASFISEWDQCKRGQSYAAERLGREDWGTDLVLEYAIAGTLLLSLRFPPDERIKWLEPGLQAAKLKDQLRSEGEIWGYLGSANDGLGRWEVSVRLYRECLKISRLIKDREKEGRTLGSLGVAYMMLGDKNEAKLSLEKALKIAREVGDRQGEGRHLGSLGLISEGFKSIGYFDQALEIARATRDREGEISHLGCLGMAWFLNDGELGNTRDLSIHPNIIMRNTRPDGSLPKHLEDRLRLENLHQSPLERAANYFKEAVMITRETGEYRGEARHLGNLGMVLFKQGDINGALRCYKQALAISEEVCDRENQVRQLENMRSAYRSLDNEDEARRMETQLKQISNEGGRITSKNIVEKFGGKEVDPFHEKYWRASREEDIKKYWSEYYQSHLGE